MPVFTKFAPQTLVQQGLDDLRMPIVALTWLQRDTHLSQYQITRWLRNEKRLETYEEQALVTLIRECRELQASFADEQGLQYLEWRDTTSIKSLLQTRREQKSKQEQQ